MASVFVDIPGIGNVEAKNAATEATLREILKAMQGIEKNTSTSLKEDKKGRDEDKKGGKEGGDKASPMGKLGKAVGTMLRPIQMVTGGFIALGTASTNLIQSFANAGDTFSGAASVFSKIPVLGGLFGAVAGAADKVLGSFQAATAGGATFGGSINEFAGSASAAGMTMDKFGALIARNSEALMTLGGTTESGANQFAKMAKDMRNSQIGAQLYGLGMTTEQVNQGMANYIRIVGTGGALQGKSSKELAAGAGAYLKELDAVAKITGQNREALQKEQEARMKDAQFLAATAKMDPQARAELNNFISQFPKESQEAIKDMITSGNITSEAAIRFNAQMGGASQEVMRIGQTVREQGKFNKSQGDEAYKYAVREAKIRHQTQEYQTLGLYGGQEWAQSTVAVAELASRDVDGKKKALTEQEKAAQAQAAAMEKNKQNIAAMSNQFQMVLANSGILETMMKLFQFTADITMKYLVPAFTLFSDAVSGVIGTMIDNLGPAVTAVGDLIMKYIYPAFQALVAFVVVDMLPGIMGAVNDFIPVITGIADIILPPLQSIGEFIFGNLTPILLGVGAAMGVYYGAVLASNIVTAAETISKGANVVATNGQTVGILASTAAFFGLNAAVLAMVWPVLAGIAALTALWIVFKKFGGDLSVVGDGLKYMWEGYKSFFTLIKMGFLKVINTISFGAVGGDALKEAEQEYADQVAEREKLAQQMSDRMAANRAEADAKEEKREKVKEATDIATIKEKQKHAAGLKDANKKEAEAKEESVKNYADPIALLKQEANQQKSAFIKDVPNSSVAGPKQLVDDAEAKKAAEAKQAEDAKKATGSGGKGGTTAPAPATQESAETLLASLNTKMDQLIKINKGTHDVNERQLSVQQSLSGDLYQNIV